MTTPEHPSESRSDAPGVFPVSVSPEKFQRWFDENFQQPSPWHLARAAWQAAQQSQQARKLDYKNARVAGLKKQNAKLQARIAQLEARLNRARAVDTVSGSPEKLSADFDEFWDSIGKRNVKQLMPRLAARAAWEARQPEIDALQAESEEYREGWRAKEAEQIRESANMWRAERDALQAENEAFRSRLKRLRVNLRAKRVQIQRQLDTLQAENERLRADMEGASWSGTGPPPAATQLREAIHENRRLAQQVSTLRSLVERIATTAELAALPPTTERGAKSVLTAIAIDARAALSERSR